MNDNMLGCSDCELMKQGAEAKVYICRYLGKPALLKERFRKKYRVAELDEALSRERTRAEARALVRCLAAGVPVPPLYLAAPQQRILLMHRYSPAITVRDYLFQQPPQSVTESQCVSLARKIGNIVRKLHVNNIIHGDLTTSNMLLVPNTENSRNDPMSWDLPSLKLILIDFGLSHTESSDEDKGVDLYVLERAVLSTHCEHPNLFPEIVTGYKERPGKVQNVLNKFEEVRARGRKRTMVG